MWEYEVVDLNGLGTRDREGVLNDDSGDELVTVDNGIAYFRKFVEPNKNQAGFVSPDLSK